MGFPPKAGTAMSFACSTTMARFRKSDGTLSIDGADPCFLRVTGRGVLDRDAYRKFEPRFNEMLAPRSIPVPLLLDLRWFRGWTLTGFFHDLQFDLRHRKTFSRIAVLGDGIWHRWITNLARPIFAAKLGFFRDGEEGRARAWLCQGS